MPPGTAGTGGEVDLRGGEALRRLAAVTDTALARLSLDALLDELLARVRTILEVDTVALLLLEGDVLRPRTAKGLEEALARDVRIPLGRGFAGRVAGEARPLLLEDASAAELVNPVLRERGVRSLLGVPILFEGRVIGVLHVGTLHTRRFDSADAQLLQLVADRIGVGIAYAELYEGERRARLRAEGEEARSRFLAELSTTLASKLDDEMTLRSVVHLAVRHLADGSVLDIVGDGGRLERVAVAGTDPAEDAQLRELLQCPPPEDDQHPLVRVLRSGEPQLLAEISDGRATDSDSRDVLRRFGIRSAIFAPLVVRGQPLGVITFVSRRLGRRFGEADLALAVEVARRVAFAVENARLYRAAEQARERVSRQAARQRKLAEASRVFAEASLDLDAVADTVVRHVAGTIGDACSLRILSDDGRWLLPLGFHHPDPEAQAALGPMVSQRHPADVGLAAPIVRTGDPLVIPVVDEAELRRLVPSEYHPWLARFPIVSLLGVPLRVRGRLTGVVMVARGAGRPYDEEDQLLLHHIADRAALAIENARLYREAEDARVAAEEASRAKDEFLATISHELRTPLAPIIAWSHLLERGQLDAARTAQAVGAIRRAARSQAQLVDDLLDVSRIVMGKLRLEVRPMDLAPVVESAVEPMRPAAEAKDIQLQSVLQDDGVFVSGDPDRLQQVVWNLVSNGIKFTPRGGRVEVRLCRLGSHVEVRVSDTGTGISPEFVPHLFERFRQADSSSTRLYGGLGLGLAIVRHLVELHGGTVEAESAGAGKGATFTVRLPVLAAMKSPLDGRRGAPAEDGDAPATPARLDDVRVLVVDDDPGTCDVIAAILEGAGANVRASLSARDAIAQLDAWRPHILVSDIGMPGENGYALMRQIRTRPPERGGRTLAIALTAYARPDDRMRALSSGFQMHVAKPVDPAELVTVLASLAIGLGGPAAHPEV